MTASERFAASAPRLEGRVLVTGAAGMLGSQLLRSAPAGIEVLGTDVAPPRDPEEPAPAHLGVDLTDEAAVRTLFEAAGPLAGVIHAAAYTAVDRAEEEEALAARINGLAPELVTAAAKAAGAPVVLVSTDFVFDGTKGVPYLEDDEPEPLGAYGRTKLEGERRATEAWPEGVRIVRTQWLYGPRGAHFPGTMLRLAGEVLAGERQGLAVVADQIGSPTSTLELAPALWDVLRAGQSGVYHAACEGRCSWHELAVATLAEAGVEGVEIAPCTTADYPTPAQRPAFSVLDCGRLTRLRERTLAPWRQALRDFIRAEKALP